MTVKYEVLARWSRLWVLVNYALFLLIITMGTLIWPSCDRNPNIVVWGIQIVILLCLGFFILSVNTVFACYSLVTLSEVIVIAVLFVSSMLYIRWQSRAWNEKEVNKHSG
jgi:uncharacterized membrane protein